MSFGEKVTKALRSQLIEGLANHNLRHITNGFVNGFLTELFDERYAWGIKDAILYDPGSMI